MNGLGLFNGNDLQFVDLEWSLLLVKILKYNVFKRHSNETKLTLSFKIDISGLHMMS